MRYYSRGLEQWVGAWRQVHKNSNIVKQAAKIFTQDYKLEK